MIIGVIHLIINSWEFNSSKTEGPLREHFYERDFKSIEFYYVSNLKQWHERFCNLVINIKTLFLFDMLRFGSSLDQTNKPEDWCNCSSQARLLRRTVAKHSIVVHLHRKAVLYRLLGMFASIGFYFFFFVCLLKWRFCLFHVYSQS